MHPSGQSTLGHGDLLQVEETNLGEEGIEGVLGIRSIG